MEKKNVSVKKEWMQSYKIDLVWCGMCLCVCVFEKKEDFFLYKRSKSDKSNYNITSGYVSWFRVQSIKNNTQITQNGKRKTNTKKKENEYMKFVVLVLIVDFCFVFLFINAV